MLRLVLVSCCALALACTPGPAAVDGGRALDAGVEMGCDASGECERDAAVEPPCNEHTFALRRRGASSVWVTGSFTGWAETPADGAVELTLTGSETWTATVRIDSPGRHQYKFIVDGSEWVTDPTNPDREDDGVGGSNSVLVVRCPALCGDLDAFDWRDTVMYFVMVDRFYDSDDRADPVEGVAGGDAVTGSSGQYEGGDLAGVTERLDYLADLGVTALWLSAPYENRDLGGDAIDRSADPHVYTGYHGYWPSPEAIDWSDPARPAPRPEVESRIGSDADLRALVETAHATPGAGGHGLKVLFDYVMNHVDIDSGLFAAHPEWFARRDDGRFALCQAEGLWDDPYWGTRCAFTDYLPPFDFDSPDARAWSVQDAVWWAREYGIDGYRLDAIKHVPTSWLTDLRAALSEAIPAPAGDRFYLVGETFAYDDPSLIRSYVDPETMLDGQFDFPYKARLCEAVFRPDHGLDGFATWLDGNDGFYGRDAVMTTWIGNHDIPRAIHFASGEIESCREGSHPGNGWTSSYGAPSDAAPYERLAVAYAIMMTNPGIPLLYYGDEIGLAGGGDPDNRRMMPWDDDSLGAPQHTLRARVRALARTRAAHPVLARGSRTTLSVDADTWVYRMGCEGADEVVVAINRGDAAAMVTLPGGAYEDLLEDSSLAVDGGALALPPRSYRVLGRR